MKAVHGIRVPDLSQTPGGASEAMRLTGTGAGTRHGESSGFAGGALNLGVEGDQCSRNGFGARAVTRTDATCWARIDLKTVQGLALLSGLIKQSGLAMNNASAGNQRVAALAHPQGEGWSELRGNPVRLLDTCVVDRIKEELGRHNDLMDAMKRSVEAAGKEALVAATTFIVAVLLWPFPVLKCKVEVSVLLALWVFVSAVTAIFVMPSPVSVIGPAFVLQSRSAGERGESGGWAVTAV